MKPGTISLMADALRAIGNFIPNSTAAEGGPNAHSANVAAADKVRAALLAIESDQAAAHDDVDPRSCENCNGTGNDAYDREEFERCTHCAGSGRKPAAPQQQAPARDLGIEAAIMGGVLEGNEVQQHAQAGVQCIVAYELHGPADPDDRESPEVRIVFTRKQSEEYVEDGWTLYRELWSSKPTRSFVGEQSVTGNAQAALSDDLPPLPEMEGLQDIPYALNTPDDWDADYRSIWQKLQVAERNKMQWRVYALKLRAILAASQPAPVVFVPGGVQALADVTGQPVMYGDHKVMPMAAPVAAAAQGDAVPDPEWPAGEQEAWKLGRAAGIEEAAKVMSRRTSSIGASPATTMFASNMPTLFAPSTREARDVQELHHMQAP